jgi:type III secretion protein L
VSEAKEEMAEQMFMNVSQSIDYFAGIERDVAKVVIQAVRKILGEFDDDELTIRMVRNALGAVRNQQQITLRIAPGLVEQVKERVHELLSVNTSLVNVQVVGDARLGVGDCLLESELGVVEASLESQIHALEQAMARRLGKQ